MSFIATTDMYIAMRNKRDLAEDKLHDMTKQRDTLIDDIAVLRANNKRLELENKKLRNKLEGAETYIDAIKTYKPMYEKLHKQYTNLTDHIRQKAEVNPNEPRYIALVNYTNRLEKGEK